MKNGKTDRRTEKGDGIRNGAFGMGQEESDGRTAARGAFVYRGVGEGNASGRRGGGAEGARGRGGDPKTGGLLRRQQRRGLHGGGAVCA